jgi:Sec-independent protein translocase protein TatA
VLKVFLISLLILLIISSLIIILIQKKKAPTQFLSIQTFLGGSSNSVSEDELNEQKKSLIEKINDFFKDSKDDVNEDNSDDGDDAGE